MPLAEYDQPRVGYVLKVYPRFSETFIVNEILAHEAAGLPIEIFSLRPPTDGHFQDVIGQVRAPVHYVPASGLKADDLWTTLQAAGAARPAVWSALAELGGEASGDVFQALWLAQAAQRYRIGHWHAHFASTATTVARLAARLTDLPFTFTAHAKDIFHASVAAADLRCKLSEAAAVITVSDFNVDFLRAEYGPAADRVVRLYNGLDLRRFSYRSPAERPPRIVGVGRLIEKKGFGDLIDACALLTERGHRFECRIIGSGELAGALQAQIERRGLSEVVTLIGPRPQSEIIAEVQSAAVFAAPCVVGGDGNRDGLPTVLLEAMALGTPCISTDVTGIPEAIRHEQTGLIAAQHSPAALAIAIERLLVDPGTRVRLAERARQLIEREFDGERNAALLRDHFQAAARPLAGVGGAS